VPTIFDNLAAESQLGKALRQHFMGSYSSVDVATGYLDLRGWSHLGDVIEGKTYEPGMAPVARVLVGMVAPSESQAILDSLQSELSEDGPGALIHDSSKALEQKERLVRHLRTQLMRGLPTKSGQETLRLMKRQLESGRVQIRVFTRRPLHGKTYILRGGGGPVPLWSYVGSSNFTGAGLFNNLELNIDVAEQDANAKLAHWFEDRWNDKYSLVITKEIIELIEESWSGEQQATPFEVYLKVCHALSQDARDGLGYVLPKSMQDLLLDYQVTAVRTLARRIVRRGGTMLGDVVGLGKTLTAVATALMLQAAEDYSTLVLCPKNLETMWREHLEAYGVEGARVVPYSMADKLLPDLKLFKLVICDESHNLRNDTTKAHEAIRDYVRRNSSKVLLLTATPYNLAFADVANQLALYIDEDEDLGIIPSAAMTKDPTLADKVDGKTNTLEAFQRSEEADDWRRLMSDHLVRRTRSFIKKSARKKAVTLPDGTTQLREYLQFADGTEFFFPTRIPHPLTHAFGDDDPASKMEDDATLDAIARLTLPRYRLSDYEDPRAPKTPEDKKYLDDIRSGRGNVSGFVRVGLFKRLSSSGHSFILSLQRQRARNELFIHAIDNKLQIPLGTFTDRQITVSDEDLESEQPLGGSLASRYQELRESAPAKTKWLNSTVFKSTLRHDLVKDNDLISTLLTRFGTWDSTRDSKVNTLIDLLRGDHEGKKVLVFSEYKDTASYVAAALEEAGVDNVGLATGDSSDPSDLARRFSPRSNRLPGQSVKDVKEPEDPIDVLIATDVLSEGQNLQDSHVIVNYDLPWAIIRLIQRAGRVDRVGQESDTVHVYLITHDKVEQQIHLRRRIRARLTAAAEAFGSDEQFFGTDDEVKLLHDFYDGRLSDDDDDGEGEADAVSEAWLAWSNAQDSHPSVTKRVLSLPDLIHSTRDRYARESTGGVACFVRTESGIDAFAMTDSDGTERLLTPAEALRVFEAEPTTPTATLRDDHFDLEAQLVRGPLTVEARAAGNLRGVRKRIWERFGGTFYAELAEDALNALHERPLTTHATNQLSIALRNKYADQDILDLLDRLHREDRLVIGSSESDELRIVCSIGVTDT
jgi:hypothetical protein